jgi:hypothetical protein
MKFPSTLPALPHPPTSLIESIPSQSKSTFHSKPSSPQDSSPLQFPQVLHFPQPLHLSFEFLFLLSSVRLFYVLLANVKKKSTHPYHWTFLFLIFFPVLDHHILLIGQTIFVTSITSTGVAGLILLILLIWLLAVRLSNFVVVSCGTDILQVISEFLVPSSTSSL